MLLIAADDVEDPDIIEETFCNQSPVNHTKKLLMYSSTVYLVIFNNITSI